VPGGDVGHPDNAEALMADVIVMGVVDRVEAEVDLDLAPPQPKLAIYKDGERGPDKVRQEQGAAKEDPE
jgi:hypothetical protein